MIVRVAPLRRFPRGQGIYDYKVPEGLTINVGSFVVAPFRSQMITALVLEILDFSPFKTLKTIAEIAEIEPLSDADVSFFKSLAEHTYESIGSILNASLPPKLKRQTKEKPKAFNPIKLHIKSADLAILQSAVRHIEKNKQCTISVSSTGFTFLICGVLMHRSKRPLLFICPNIKKMNHLASIATAYSNSVRTYGGTMSKTHSYLTAKAIREGTCDVIVATRIGTLIPPSQETQIIMIDSGSDDFHQIDQRPHYDARWCLKNRIATHNNTVTFMDVLPRVEESPITLDLWLKPNTTKIIPFSDPRERTKPWFLTNTMIDAMRNSDPNKLFIIYHNRLEYERLLLCGECGETAVKDQSICDSCGSTKIRSKGLGIKKVYEAISNIIKDRLVTVLQAQEEMPSHGIVISTRTIISRWPKHDQVCGVGIVLAEQLFAHHGFRSLERARRTIRMLSSNAEFQNIPCIIQSIDPEIVSEALGLTEKLIKEEINSRKMFKYPPFGKLIDVQKQNSIHTKQYKLNLNEQRNELLTLPMIYDIIVN
jgi:primosomal protein N'